MNNAERQEVVTGRVMVDKVEKTEFSKEKSKSAQVRQIIKTTSFYPSKQSSNQYTNSMFDNQDFGYEEQEFEAVENRVAFFPVPETMTVEELQKRIDNIPLRNAAIGAALDEAGVAELHLLPQAAKAKLCLDWDIRLEKFNRIKLSDPCIYKILSNDVIITSQQAHAIRVRLLTKDKLANKQVARYGETSDQAGKLVLDKNAKPQYRATFFSEFNMENQDWRTDNTTEFYASPEIQLELTGVVADVHDVAGEQPPAQTEPAPDTQGQSV